MSSSMIKFVEDLKNFHIGKEIWIIGTGKSLDDFSPNFFNNKISIALNGAIWKYENSTYWLGHHEFWRIFFRDEKPELLEKCIIPYPFPGPFVEGEITDPVLFFKQLSSKPYWMKYVNAGLFNKSIAETTLDLIYKSNGETRIPFRAISSVIHLAIETAFLMGAKKITLVGCENDKFENLPSRAELGRSYPGAPYKSVYKKMPEVDMANRDLKLVLEEKYNVKLQKYYNKETPYYKKGYAEI